MKNKITPEQEKIFDAIHNLVWHRITHDEKYLKAIPEVDAPDFHDWIYYIRYDFLEYDDSGIQAVLYLNGKHYEYFYLPESLRIITVSELKDSEVEERIRKIYSGEEHVDEFFEDFELYDPDEPLPEKMNDLSQKREIKNDRAEVEDIKFDDLPF